MATGTSDDSNSTVTEDVLSEGMIDAIAVRVAAQLGERSGTSGLTNTQGKLLGCVKGWWHILVGGGGVTHSSVAIHVRS